LVHAAEIVARIPRESTASVGDDHLENGDLRLPVDVRLNRILLVNDRIDTPLPYNWHVCPAIIRLVLFQGFSLFYLAVDVIQQWAYISWIESDNEKFVAQLFE